MGIARGSIKLLMREGNREKFSGNILTVGRQDVYATSKNLNSWAKEMKFSLRRNINISLSQKEEFRRNAYISDIAFFQSLGFNKVDSIDYADFEQCLIRHDLNEDVPCKLHNKYDLIFDGGTSEHIFNFPKVLENYNKMLKVGGRIIHSLPASNFVDHGFYMFSPTLFNDYYSANKWEIIDLLLIRLFPKHNVTLWDIYKYESNRLSLHSFGGLNGMYAIFFIAKKTINSTFDAPVQQAYYLREWKNSQSNTSKHSNEKYNDWIKKIAKQLPAGMQKNLQPFYYRFLSKIPLRFHLKRIARY